MTFGGNSLFSADAIGGGIASSHPFNTHEFVTAGRNVAFFVGFGSNENYYSDTTQIRAVITFVPYSYGDYNSDGTVNAADYVVWRKKLGQSGDGPPADGDLDGHMDQAGYDLWRAQFGERFSAPSGAALGGFAVPEPLTWLLFTTGGLISILRFRKPAAMERSGISTHQSRRFSLL